MSNGPPSPLDRLEKSYEELLKRLEEAIAYPIRVLERYAVRMYQFFCDIFFKTIRLGWLSVTLLVYVLAPTWCASFGDEMRRQGWNWVVKTLGRIVLAAGLGGLAVMAYGLFVYFISPRRQDGTPEDPLSKSTTRPAFFPVLMFDLICAASVFIAHYAMSSYAFASPLLKWLQSVLNIWLPPSA